MICFYFNYFFKNGSLRQPLTAAIIPNPKCEYDLLAVAAAGASPEHAQHQGDQLLHAQAHRHHWCLLGYRTGPLFLVSELGRLCDSSWQR